MSADVTNITIKKDTWRKLHQRKEPGMSHDDVLRDLLDGAEEEPDGEKPATN